MHQSSFSKKLTNTFGKSDSVDQRGALFSRTQNDDRNQNIGRSGLINTKSLGIDEALITEQRHTGQDIFRRQHPSVVPDNQNTGLETKPLFGFSGPQLNLGSTPKTMPKVKTLNNIFRQSQIKRNLNDMYSDNKPLNQSSTPSYTPKGGKSLFGIRLEDQSTSKPKFNQTAVRNPTMQKQTTQLHETPLNKQKQIFKSNLSHVSPNVQVAKNDHTTEKEVLDKVAWDGHQFTSQQFHDATKAVTSRLTEQFTLSDDININDIDLQLQKFPQHKQTANYSPFALFPTQNIEIPEQILEIAKGQKGWLVEMSKRNKVVYFGIGNTLVVWNYDQQMNQGVMRTMLKNNIKHKQFAQISQSKLMVIGQLSFTQEISCIKELTSRNLATGWQNCNIAIPGCLNVLVATASEIVLVHVRKAENSQSISVQWSSIQPMNQISDPVTVMVELEKTGRVFYDGTTGNVSEIVFKDYKNTFSGLFIKEIDKRRLEKLDHQNENFISKILPYAMKLRFNKVVQELKIDEQRNILYCLGTVIGGQGDQQSVIEVFFLGDLADQCKLLTTIYLWKLYQQLVDYCFPQVEIYNKYVQAKEYQIQTIEPITFAQSQQHHLMIVTHRGMRIFLKFDEVQANTKLFRTEIEKQGLQSDLLMSNNFTGDWGISAVLTNFPNDLDLHNEVNAKEISGNFLREHPIQNADPDQRSNHNVLVDFFYFDRLKNMTMYVLQSNQSNPDWLKIYFIKSNDAQYALLKQNSQNYETQNMSGCISQDLSIVMIGETRQKSDGINLSHQRVQMSNENVVKVQDQIPLISTDLMVTLGIELPQGQPTYGKNNQTRHYYPSSELERQVFLKGQQYHVLTDKRLIQFSSLMPIDKLVMVLFQITRTNNQLEIDNLMMHYGDFSETYGQSETCAMLIQIISDKKTEYNVYSRFRDVFALNMKMLIEQSNDPTNIRGYRQSASRANSTGLSRSRVGLQATQSQNRSGINGLSLSFQRRNRFKREHENQENLSNLIEFNLDEPDQYETIQATRELQKLAFDMLTTHGDSVNQNQRNELEQLDSNYLKGVKSSQVDNESNLLFMYSSKHQGLYLYLYRILQPIWETGITSQTNNQNLSDQVCNVNIFLPVREKLQDFYDFVAKNAFNLQGKVYQGKQHLTTNQDVVPLFELNQVVQDYIEVAEKQSCIELQAFLKRCLDVIDFLDHIAPNQEQFNMILRDLEQPMLKNLSTTSFKNLVNSNSNPLVRKILDKAIQVNNNGDPSKTVEFIRLRAQKAQNLCKTLFSPGENQIFIGESLLQNSLRETDIEKKEKLMKEAMHAFSTDPCRVDIKALLPQLAENANFIMIIYLCIAQLQHLNPVKDTQNIEDLYDIIVTIFNMLDRVITDHARARDLVKSKRIDPEIDGQHSMIFLEQLVKVKDASQHIRVRDKIVDMICQKKEWQIISYVFNFFLMRDLNVDFIMETLDDQELKKNCDSFITKQSKTQCMTRSQFLILKRIYEKKSQVESLASLIVQVVTDQIILKKRDVYLERPSAGQEDQLEIDQWFEDQPTCEERLELVNWTSKLLKDAQSKFQFGSAMRPQSDNRENGQTGILIEQQISLDKELQDCQVALKEQFQAIKSAKLLVKILQDKAAHQQQQPDQQDRLNDLGCFITQLDQRLMSIKDLTNKYYEFDLADRKAYVLIHKSQPTDKQTSENLRTRQREAIKHLVEVTHENYPQKEDFQQAVLRQIEMLFETQLDERLKQFLLIYADQVSIIDPVSAESIRAGSSWWLAEIILGKMCIEPSKFIKKIENQVPDRPSKHVAIMACFREWVKLVTVGNYRITKLAQQTATSDLRSHGPSMYKETLLDYLSKWLKDNQLTLSKQDQDSMTKLLAVTCQEFDNLLTRTIPGYQSFKPERPKPQIIERRPLHAPQKDQQRQEPERDERHRQTEKRNQNQRSFTPSRAVLPEEFRQAQDENQLMLDEVKPEESSSNQISLVQMRKKMMESK